MTSSNSAFKNLPFLYPYVHIYPGLLALFVSLFSGVSLLFVSIDQIPLSIPLTLCHIFPRSFSARKLTVSIPSPSRLMNNSTHI